MIRKQAVKDVVAAAVRGIKDYSRSMHGAQDIKSVASDKQGTIFVQLTDNSIVTLEVKGDE